MFHFVFFYCAAFLPLLASEVISMAIWREDRVRGYRRRWKK
ncbi:hypothetical protein CC53_gp106 [Rhizobium phage vB_RleS_L338C]|nr:hypothetical protein CC53_gp106 [Rhizobium phage vB_RleS_L338C]AHC30523.1 hypothetical protein L338C_106 [Rhizobium phage vB_RleS_L338C]QNH72201.1 hypothetical protein P11VFA_044 [Rhizobium phage P11VFA]